MELILSYKFNSIDKIDLLFYLFCCTLKKKDRRLIDRRYVSMVNFICVKGVNIMFLEERQELIVRMVERDGKVKVKELSAKFKVTEDCIRKDLDSLERQGRLKRTYGGAVKLTQSVHMIEVSRHRLWMSRQSAASHRPPSRSSMTRTWSFSMFRRVISRLRSSS